MYRAVYILCTAACLLLERQRRKLTQKRNRVLAAIFIKAVMCPFSVLTAGDYAGITKNFHVIGKAGLCNFKFFLQNAGAFFSALQQFQNGKTVRVAQCLKYFCVFLMCSHSVISKCFDIKSIPACRFLCKCFSFL